MKYAIVTPTYVKHFVFIKSYLSSFRKYVADKENIKLYFIISRSEREVFEREITPYKELNITTLIFEEILEFFGVHETSEKLLKKYGRFTFQTLKKYYGLLFIPEEKSLVLDSESVWINETKMSKLFEDFFSSPRLLGSSLDKRPRSFPFFWQFIENINFLMGQKCSYWFLEDYMWFYEKKILQALIKKYGSPIQLAEKLFQPHPRLTDRNDAYHGIFEIILYQNFIYFNQKKYHYNFFNVDTVMEKYLSCEEINQYRETFYKLYKGGCGVLEHACLLITDKNIQGLSHVFKKLGILILRCNLTNNKNLYKLQRSFLRLIQPTILASSQEHAWGVSRQVLLLDKNLFKFKKHFSKFMAPILNFGKWIKEVIKLICYGLKIIFKILLISISRKGL